MLDVIKKLRTERGITQKQLGDAVGVSQQAVNAYENTETQADYMTLQRIADYFSVTVDYLLGRNSENSVAEELEKYSFSNEDMDFIRRYLHLTSQQKKSIDIMIRSFEDTQ